MQLWQRPPHPDPMKLPFSPHFLFRDFHRYLWVLRFRPKEPLSLLSEILILKLYRILTQKLKKLIQMPPKKLQRTANGRRLPIIIPGLLQPLAELLLLPDNPADIANPFLRFFTEILDTMVQLRIGPVNRRRGFLHITAKSLQILHHKHPPGAHPKGYG